MTKSNKILRSTVNVNNKRYDYILKSTGGDTVNLHCEAAGISQDFLSEDIVGVILDLPTLIISEQEYKKEDVIRFRVSSKEKFIIEKQAIDNGFNNISGYIRSLVLK